VRRLRDFLQHIARSHISVQDYVNELLSRIKRGGTHINFEQAMAAFFMF
jgi:hypothetical protein